MSDNTNNKTNSKNEIRHSFDISEHRDRVPKQNTGTSNTKPRDIDKMTGHKK